MLQVYLASDPTNAEIIKDFLRGHGIDAIVKGAYLWSGRGELPADSYPSIWVTSDADAPRAAGLLRDFESGRSRMPTWICPRCGERLGGQFTDCWNCGFEKPND